MAAQIDVWIDGEIVKKPASFIDPTPPTPLGPSDYVLTPRQLRMGLIVNGFDPDDVEAQIEAIPDNQTRLLALNEWRWATQFRRDHDLIAQVGGALGLASEQIDAMWMAAKDL